MLKVHDGIRAIDTGKRVAQRSSYKVGNARQIVEAETTLDVNSLRIWRFTMTIGLELAQPERFPEPMEFTHDRAESILTRAVYGEVIDTLHNVIDTLLTERYASPEDQVINTLGELIKKMTGRL